MAAACPLPLGSSLDNLRLWCSTLLPCCWRAVSSARSLAGDEQAILLQERRPAQMPRLARSSVFVEPHTKPTRHHHGSVAGTASYHKLPVSLMTILHLLCFLHSVSVSRFQFQEDKLPVSPLGEKLESCSTVTGGLQRDSVLSSPFFFFRWICLLLRSRRNSLLATSL